MKLNLFLLESFKFLILVSNKGTTSWMTCYLRSEKHMTSTPSSMPGTGSLLANISHWTRSRSICCSAPVLMAFTWSSSNRFMKDLARCWQLDIQAIMASLLGRLVKLWNTVLRNAIKSISHCEANPETLIIKFTSGMCVLFSSVSEKEQRANEIQLFFWSDFLIRLDKSN